MKKTMLIFLSLLVVLNFTNCGDGDDTALQTKQLALYENGAWTTHAGGDSNVTVGADATDGPARGIMFEFTTPIDATGYTRFVIEFKEAPDLEYWHGGQLQSEEDEGDTGWMDGTLWNAAIKSASFPFKGDLNPAAITKVIFKGGGPSVTPDPVWTMEDIEKVYLLGQSAKKGICDICFYDPCMCDILCWECGEEECICTCPVCGQLPHVTIPPEIPSYYDPVPEGAVWLGCYEPDSQVQFRWQIRDAALREKIKTGEINRVLLYLDADKIATNTTPAGRVGTITMAVNANKTDGTATWQQQSGAFNYTQVSPANIKSQKEPITFYLDHSYAWDRIDWEGMFQIYIQCTASQGYVEGLHFISAYLAPRDGDPEPCEDCRKIICECEQPFPYKLPANWTWANTDTQLGYGFGVRYGDPSYTNFKEAKYLVFEAEGHENFTTLPRFRIVMLVGGNSSHSNNTIDAPANSTFFSVSTGEKYYIVVRLEEIVTNNVTDWADALSKGTSARFYLQDGWPLGRIKSTWLLDSIENLNPADKAAFSTTAAIAVESRHIPGYLTKSATSIFGPGGQPE